MNDTYAIAFKLHTLGFSVIPSGCGDSGKAPLVNWSEYQIRRPTEAELDKWNTTLKPRLWGIVTGAISGVFVVDADNAEARAILEATGLEPHIITPRGGGHYYFRHAGHPVKTEVGVLPKVDIRGDGGFVNAVGSRKDGEYRIVHLPTPNSLYPWEKLPAAIREAMDTGHKPSSPATAPVGDITIPEGQRNGHLTSLAGSMRRRGMPQAAIEAALLQVNQTQCQPPLPEDEVMRIAGSVARYQPPTTVTTQGFNLTDLGNAERLISQYGDRLRFCYERKRWLIWSGQVWEWDEGGKITALAKLTVRNIYHEAANEPDEKRRKQLADHAHRSESDHRINAMINLAQSEPGIPVKLTELDSNPWLFNCLNGTLDLRTGQLLPHRKEDLLTIIVPVEHHSDAQCPLWLKFLDRVTNHNTELVGYLQRAVGYSLTGDTKSQVLFFLYGLGNNGKSTFVTTIRKLTGEYGGRVNTDLFMLKDRNTGGPKEALANLRGKRYVVASELDEGRRLAVSLIKDMTGGETIKADRKYEHEIEYQPTHKLWLVGNHKPVITDTTLSIWRRMKLIPFTVTILDNEIDLDLPSKLEAELPGILAWAVKGCLDWQQYGLKEPGVVATATAGYRHEQDVLVDFIEDCCRLELPASIPKADLKDEYHKWCQDNSVEPASQRTFRARLIEKGVTESKSGSVRYWKGITLKSRVPNGTENVPDSDINGTSGTEKSGDSLYVGEQKKSTENPVQDVPLSQNAPDYPTQPCRNCGCGDYWLTDWNEWLCSRCHPKPEWG